MIRRSFDNTAVILLAVIPILAAIFFGMMKKSRAPNRPKLESLSKIGQAISKKPAVIPESRQSPVPLESYSKERFLKMVQEDQFCELLTQGNAPFEDQLEALLSFPSIRLDTEAEQELKYLFLGGDAPMLGKPNLRDSSQILDFFNALVLSGLLVGSKPQALSDQTAIELFQDLETQDSGNAAFPFFNAAVMSAIGAGDNAVQTEFRRAFDADRFDAFYSRISSQLADKGYASASAMLLSISILTQLPVPNFSKVTSLLYPLINQGDESFSTGALKLGTLLMQEGNREKLYSGGPLLGSLEYASGRGIYLRAWKKLRPHEKEPYFQPIGEWMKTGRPKSAEPSSVFFQAITEPAEECSRVEIDRTFEKLKQTYRDGL